MARRKTKTNEKRVQLEDGRIRLNNVRISFPTLFQARAFQEGQTPKYSATFILDPDEHAEELEAIEGMIDELIDEKLKGKAPKDEKICLRDGDEKKDLDGYAGMMFLNASNRVRPTVRDRNKAPLTAEDGVIYAGCRVNAIITLWAQDNKFGKGINANLLGVQFYGDDEAFSGGGVADDEDFDDFDD